MISGQTVGAFAASEPDAGSDIGSLSTRAAPVEDGWRLNGTKIYTTNAPAADLFLVLARTAEGPSFSSTSAFLVPRDAPGLTVSAATPKMGLTAAMMGTVTLDNCSIGDQHLLGRPGGGMAVFSRAMLWERSCILAPAVGVMQAWTHHTLDHLRRRHQFGKPLSQFASNRARLVQMQRELTTALLIARETATRLDAADLRLAEASMIKLQLSDSFIRFAQLTADCFGGLGYLADGGAEELVRDSLGTRSASGTSDVHTELIADAMGA